VVVPDITSTAAFRSALDDVDYIFHLASPMPGKGSDFKADYVDPAVQGTESILYAALEFPRIRRVFVMSSVLALTPVDAVTVKYVSAKENTAEVIPVDLQMSFPEGFSGHGIKYAASKILAHQATRDFLKKNHPHYNLITFHPVFVLGDSLVQHSAQEISGMNALLWASIFSEKPRLANAWVHVRDVADAHINALGTEIETGKEFILSRPVVSWEEVGKFVQSHYPTLGCKLDPPFEGGWTVDTTAADTILGIQWRSVETIVQDVVNQQLELKASSSSI